MPATTTATTTAAAELTASLRAHLEDLRIEKVRADSPRPDQYVLAFPGHPLFFAQYTEAGTGKVRKAAGSILKAWPVSTLDFALHLCKEITNGAGEHPTPELWRHAIEREEWSVREAIEMIERAAAARDEAAR